MNLNRRSTLLIIGNIIWMVGQKYGFSGILWLIWALEHGTSTAGGMPIRSFMVILTGWKILRVIPNMNSGWNYHIILHRIFYIRGMNEA